MTTKTITSLLTTAIIASSLTLSTAYAAEPIDVIDSGNDGNSAWNTLDKDLSTRWSANGNDGSQWLRYDFGSPTSLSGVSIAFYKGDSRSTYFKIESSTDATSWTTEVDSMGSGSKADLEDFSFSDDVSARYIRYVGYGNSSNTWNSVTEIEFSDGDDTPPSDAVTVPALIEAEDYDAFYDTTSVNSGGQYRTDAVDIQTTSDTGGGYNVGWVKSTEWLEYDINVTSAGTYTADIRLAARKAVGSFNVLVDGNVTDSVAVPATGGWQSWQTQTVDLGELNTGEHTIRLDVTGNNFNINWIDVKQGDVDFCEQYPDDESCQEPPFCELYPEDESCQEPPFCDLYPDDETCQFEKPKSELTCDEMYSCWSDDNTGNVAVTGTTYTATPDSLEDALAKAVGGDEIIITQSGDFSIKGFSASSPVLIRASSVGATALTNVVIENSNNIAIQGFVFEPSNEESTLVKVVSSTNIKILRNEFDHAGVTESQTTIVLTGTSQYIEIAYNTFKNKDVSNRNLSTWEDKITGSYIKTQYDGPGLIAKNVHIHRNNFNNIKHYIKTGETSVAGDSDREVIAMGIADAQDEITNNVVEYNLFDNCDGENEIITVKTSNNVFRYNTFKNSMGSLSFRLGNNNIALGNYFYGEGASANPDDDNYETGGIRTYSDGHIIRDNFMQNLTGLVWRLPILVDNGDDSDTLGGDGHQNSTNVQVYNNTLVNNLGGLTIGSNKYGNKPTDIAIIDNLVVGNSGELFTEVTSSNNTWSGNEAFAYDGATPGMAQEVLSSMPDTTPFYGPLTTNHVGPDAP